MQRRLLSTSASKAARASRGDQGKAKKAYDPLDIENMSSDFLGTPSRVDLDKMFEQSEYLRYLRLEQMQFPQLRAMRQKFRPPTKDQVVQVRYQHYQSEEDHPAANKVVVTVSVPALQATKAIKSDDAARKFRLLAGPRWNSRDDTVKISCEQYTYQQFNEHWCSETLDKLIHEANTMKESFDLLQPDKRPTMRRLVKSGKANETTIKDFPKEWLPPIAQTRKLIS